MITYHPYDQTTVTNLRAGGPDAYGMPAERAVSDGKGKPCRSCLNTIPAGAQMLICAAKPFPVSQPYAETGPIFLCAEDCTPYRGHAVPPVLRVSPHYLVKGYSHDYRIVGGTGKVTPAAELETDIQTRLDMDGVAFVDVRSATNNCFLTRMTGTP